MTRKINLILCILIVLIFVGQTFLMLQPYFNYTPKLSKYEIEVEGKTAAPKDTSLMQFVWTEYSNMEDFLIDSLQEAGMIEAGTAQQKKNQLGEQSNSYVLGLVGITVLGAVVAVMTIFTRKSLVHYCFTLGWAACGLWAFFGDNYVIQNMGTEVAISSLLPTLQILSVAGAVLVLARAYPWFYSRFIYKAPIDLEALNA